MKKEIRIYIEGGGTKASRTELRLGFGDFLRELRDRARNRGIGFRPIPFGSRENTFDAFRRALRDHPGAFNALLVDSEGPVTTGPWEHLKSHSGDNWDNPGAEDKHCHLMVQAMEAWLIADREKLGEYYGRDFHDESLPKTANVEEIPKDSLKPSLRRASRNTKKGAYDESRHAPEILRIIRSSEVRRKAHHCERLFGALFAEIGSM